jgi:hypothetical protein
MRALFSTLSIDRALPLGYENPFQAKLRRISSKHHFSASGGNLATSAKWQSEDCIYRICVLKRALKNL